MTDYLEIADSLLSGITGGMPPNAALADASVAIGAALIALAKTQRELVAEQRKTNEHLGRIADALDFQAVEGTLGDFTTHLLFEYDAALDNFTTTPRCQHCGGTGIDDVTGIACSHCTAEDDWPRDQQG